MIKIILFLMLSISIFSIEKNISIGRYTQEGFYRGQGKQNFNFLVINYGEFYIQGSEIGFGFYNNELKITPFIKYDSITGMEREDLDKELQNLDSRDSPKMLGMKIARTYKNINYEFSFAKDFTSEAYKLTSSIERQFRPLRPIFIIPNIKLSYYTREYGKYFYGISQEEASISNLESFKGKDGFILDLNLAFMMFFSENFGISLRSGYKKIDSNWKSPIVESTESLNTSFVIIYRFL